MTQSLADDSMAHGNCDELGASVTKETYIVCFHRNTLPLVMLFDLNGAQNTIVLVGGRMLAQTDEELIGLIIRDLPTIPSLPYNEMLE